MNPIDTPFRYVIIDNFLPLHFADKIYKELRHLEVTDSFYKYDTPFEKKIATDKWELFPASIKQFFMTTFTKPFIEVVETNLKMTGLFGDPSLRGGGIHIHMAGTKLDVHADRQVHPSLDSYRRANAILYMNKTWDPEWGGELELWDKDVKQCVKKILPVFNRMVIFETSSTSFHGMPEILKCPENFMRYSLATYFWSSTIPEKLELNTGSTDFKALPNDAIDPEKEALRVRRKVSRLESNV